MIQDEHSSRTEFGIYRIYRKKDSFLMATCMGMPSRRDATSDFYNAESSAKDAAQADFARRTLKNMDVEKLLAMFRIKEIKEPDEMLGPS